MTSVYCMSNIEIPGGFVAAVNQKAEAETVFQRAGGFLSLTLRRKSSRLTATRRPAVRAAPPNAAGESRSLCPVKLRGVVQSEELL